MTKTDILEIAGLAVMFFGAFLAAGGFVVCLGWMAAESAARVVGL